MNLRPIYQTEAENRTFVTHPDCRDSLYMSMDVYRKVGFTPPWIGYYVQVQEQLVGVAAFKGKPRNGKVEIAYGTFPPFQRQGIGTEICRQLVLLASQTDPSVTITARTFNEENYSTRILTKNGFTCMGTVWDEEDGNVWEWEFIKAMNE